MKTRKLNLKNPGPVFVAVAGLLLVALKLVLCSSQQLFLWPEEAKLDDMAMYNAAVSIAEGGWLGGYGWLTLAKHSFFALWVAVLHWLHIPFLMGGQLLWVAACFAAGAAFAPLFKNRWLPLGLFAVLLFNPASTANPAEMGGYITRVYRDNIFPALCLLCIAGMAGCALRLWQSGRIRPGWLVLAGAAFAAGWLCREDGWWLLFFVAAAAVVMAAVVLRQKGVAVKDKLKRCAALLLPFVVLAAGLLGWAGANAAVYGRFILSDFAAGEFADAYGAMTRIEHEDWQPKIGVPRQVRQKLYAAIPAFAAFEPLLESEGYLGRYAGLEEGAAPETADYDSGSFYWALREAAATLGYYDTPAISKAFFSALAADINARCDDGTLPAGPARSSVSPPIRAEYVGPVAAEAGRSLWFCATFQQCEAGNLWSPHSNDPGFYAETIAPMEAFLHDKAHTATVAGGEAPYYSPWQNLCYKLFGLVRWVYAVLTPAALVAALGWLAAEGMRLVRGARGKTGQPGGAIPFWLLLGLLLCIVLRAFMIAFVTVSSFHIGTYVMYLASIHPLMLLFGFAGTALLVRGLWQRRQALGAGPGGAVPMAGEG